MQLHYKLVRTRKIYGFWSSRAQRCLHQSETSAKLLSSPEYFSRRETLFPGIKDGRTHISQCVTCYACNTVWNTVNITLNYKELGQENTGAAYMRTSCTQAINHRNVMYVYASTYISATNWILAKRKYTVRFPTYRAFINIPRVSPGREPRKRRNIPTNGRRRRDLIPRGSIAWLHKDTVVI